MKNRLFAVLALTLVATLNLLPSTAFAQGTAFTYQGRLNSSGSPANGSYDLTFTLYTTNFTGTAIAGSVTNSAVAVTNGLFTTLVNFGPGLFTGTSNWLEIAVSTNGANTFATLSPRQQVTPVPYAIYSASVPATGIGSGTAGINISGNAYTATTANSVSAGAVTAPGIASGQVVKSLNGLTDGVTLSPGANVSITPIGNTLTIASTGGGGSGWSLTGNAGTTAGVDFLGTTDNQPLELWVNGVRALRLEPGVSGFAGEAPNVIGGSSANFVANGIVGATISGGGAVNYEDSGFNYTNSVTADFGTVGGGQNNTAGSYGSTVGGGYINTASGYDSTVGGGAGNTAVGGSSTVGGGDGNTASDYYSTVGGGSANAANGLSSTVSGGEENNASANDSTVAGGSGNNASANDSTVGGGGINTASGSASTVGGGLVNTASGISTTVPGGYGNSASGNYSFAAGSHANATNQGAFVWADSQTVAFSSTANDQFSIRAQGGVRLDNSTSMAFGSQPREMLQLYSDPTSTYVYGLGVQTSTFYIRTGTNGGFAWYQGGSYNGNQNNAGGGKVMMTLDSSGNLRTTTGTIASLSDRNAKADFSPVNPQAVLARVSALPLTTWRYKTADASQRHIGPMAQDFYAAFNVGLDDKSICVVDEGGVALAAIQGLNEKVDDKDATIQQQSAEIADLKARLEKLEQLMTEKLGGAK
jgi:hypothetical protein